MSELLAKNALFESRTRVEQQASAVGWLHTDLDTHHALDLLEVRARPEWPLGRVEIDELDNRR